MNNYNLKTSTKTIQVESVDISIEHVSVELDASCHSHVRHFDVKNPTSILRHYLENFVYGVSSHVVFSMLFIYNDSI